MTAIALLGAPAIAQFGAATGEARVRSTALYEFGGVPAIDSAEQTLPVALTPGGAFRSAGASTPEANAQAFVNFTLDPSRMLISGSSNANAWCDAPEESCDSEASALLSLVFDLPHGGGYVIGLIDVFVQERLSSRMTLRHESLGVIWEFEQDVFIVNQAGTLAPGRYTLQAESVATADGESVPHIGGYAAWTIAMTITPARPPCPGDATQDGIVDFTDVTTVLANFGRIGAISMPGDADGSGVVEFADLTEVLANFGEDCR